MAGYDKQIYKKQAENMAAALTDTEMFKLVVKRKFQNRYDKVLMSHFLVHVSYDGVYSNISSTLWCVYTLSSIRIIYSAQRNLHYPQRLHG